MTVYSNKCDYKKRLKSLKDWDMYPVERKKLEEFANEYAKGRITGRIGKNIDGGIEDVLYKLKLPLSRIKKDFTKITPDDLKKFVDDLIDDKIKRTIVKRVDGKMKRVEIGNYALKGKEKFLKTLVLYLKFRLEDDPILLAKCIKVTKIIITHVEKEPKSLSYEEFDKLYDATSTIEQKYYLLMNVWGGFRASEFHGIRKQDITLPTKDEEYVKILIRHENSKTKGRLVSLYGSKCRKIVEEYLNKRKKEGLGVDEEVFKPTHNAIKQWLRRFGKKVIGRNCHPHLFRSTSATWNVDKGILTSYTDLCTFYGWYYGSPTPSVYLNRSKISLHNLDKNVKSTQMEELKEKMEKQEEDMTLLKTTLIKEFKAQALAELKEELGIMGSKKKGKRKIK